MKATIYHNSNCSKSRATFALLKEKGVALDVVEYLKTPPSKETLEHLLGLLDMDACGLVRTGEAVYKEKYAGKTLSGDECLDAMVADPVLIQRPIVVAAGRAAIGRPPENVLALFD